MATSDQVFYVAKIAKYLRFVHLLHHLVAELSGNPLVYYVDKHGKSHTA
jgi:hypothetical protein